MPARSAEVPAAVNRLASRVATTWALGNDATAAAVAAVAITATAAAAAAAAAAAVVYLGQRHAARVKVRAPRVVAFSPFPSLLSGVESPDIQ
jgi:hypothetical protein